MRRGGSGMGLRTGRLVGLVSACVALVVVASGCSAAVSDPLPAPATGGSWDPQSLPGLGITQTSAGAAAAVYTNSVVTENQGLAVSTSPMLKLESGTAGQQYQFTVTTLGGVKDKTVWQGQAGTNQVVVPPGRLTSGELYMWTATNVSSNQTSAPAVFSVDDQRSGKQATMGLGVATVELANGRLSLSLPSRTVSSNSGNLGVRLDYLPAQAPSAGLPGNWRLSASGQTVDHVQVYADGSVALVDVHGMSWGYSLGQTYPGPSGAGSVTSYVPVNPPGRQMPTAYWPTLVRNVDATFTATMPNGSVAVFGAADGGVAPLQETFNGVSPAPVVTATGGRVTSVADSASSGLSVSMQYQGSDDCPDVPDGFAPYPDGALCSVTYPDESTTNYYYIQDAGGNPLLARVVDYPQTSDYKASVTDIQYDLSGRPVQIREPVAAMAQAAGVRTDTGALVTSIGYDSSGAVSQVTKPAATQGAVAPVWSFEYSQAKGQAKVSSNGPAPQAGYVAQYSYDPTTLQTTAITNSKGRTATQVWNSSNDLLQSTQDEYGRKTTYTYNSQGLMTQVAGPFTGSSPATSDLTQTYAYDQDLSTNPSKPMQGFNLTYWANDQFTGAPAGRDYGPKTSDGKVAASTQLVWDSSPIPALPNQPASSGSNPWSARLTGTLTVPGSGTDAQPYTFALQGQSSRMWIDNQSCAGSTCTLSLTPGTHQIRVDVAVTIPGNDGGASVNVQWQPPGQPQLSSIPMSAIAPGYGVRSTVKKNDELSTGAANETTVVNDYQQPWTAKPTSGWIQTPTDQQIGTASQQYEPFDPDNGQFGRTTTAGLPAGNQINYTYYGTDETADSGCQGIGSSAQHGLLKSTTRGEQTYISYYDAMARTIASTISAQGQESDPTCTYYDDAGNVSESFTPARGEQPSVRATGYRLVNGDPLQTVTVTVIGDDSYQTSATYDIYGNQLTFTDMWGTTQHNTYDPITFDLLTTVTTPANGPATTTQLAYSPEGDQQSVTIDNVQVATLTPPAAGGTTITYSNGVTQTIALDPVGNLQGQTWTTSDNKTVSYTRSVSPTTRLLNTEAHFANGENATFDYVYDINGRLTQANLTSNMAVAHKNWNFEFSGNNPQGTNPKAGLNSNRTAMSVDGATTTYGYNNNDQLTETTDPSFTGTINYSTWGEITNLGSLTLDYAAGGEITTVTDTDSGESVDYLRVGGDIVQRTRTNADKTQTISRNSVGGLILDAHNAPQWHIINLPGGVNLVKDIGADTTWQFQDANGNHMWTATATGTDIADDHHIYSPYGQDLTTETTTTPAPPNPPTHGPTPATTTPPTHTPAPPHPTTTTDQKTTTPTPTAGTAQGATDLPPPNQQWNAGSGFQIDELGIDSVIAIGPRLYIPQLGRFTSPDPIDQGSVNAYDYSNQDPINHLDASGGAPLWRKILGRFLQAAITVAGLALTVLAGQTGMSSASSSIWKSVRLIATAAAGAIIAGGATAVGGITDAKIEGTHIDQTTTIMSVVAAITGLFAAPTIGLMGSTSEGAEAEAMTAQVETTTPAQADLTEPLLQSISSRPRNILWGRPFSEFRVNSGDLAEAAAEGGPSARTDLIAGRLMGWKMGWDDATADWWAGVPRTSPYAP